MDPRISVIIPVFNDSKGLEETLRALLRQNYPEEFFEIIVVDNGSTDLTFEKAKSMAHRHPGRIKVLQESSIRGSYAARNKGIEASRGELICFIDADVTMDSDYLRKIDDFFRNTSVHYLGCEVKVYSDHGNLSVRYQKGKAFNVQWYLENRQFAPTCCLSIKRSVLEQVAPFDDRLESGGDWEFGRRVHTAGFSQAFAEGITVYHPARRRYRDLLKKKTRCARGEAQLNHYFPGEYENMPRKMLGIRNYLPANPWRIKQEFEKRAVPTTLAESLALSCFHIPLSLGRLWSYVLERIKLNRKRAEYPT